MTPPSRFAQIALLGLVVGASGCSGTSATTAPSTTTTTTTTGTATSTPASTCTFTVSTLAVSATAAGGASTVAVTTQSGCSWTATPSSSFITIASGATGSGSGSVVFNVAQNPTTTRTALVTIGGQSIVVTQAGAGIIVAFDMFDAPSQAGSVTACRIRGAPGYPVTSCPLTTTARTTLPGNSLVNWAWTVKYTYDGQAKTQAQSTGSIQDFAVYEYCGLNPSSAGGTVIPLSVTLTVTDNNGVTATATSGTGNQPALSLVAYTCS